MFQLNINLTATKIAGFLVIFLGMYMAYNGDNQNATECVLWGSLLLGAKSVSGNLKK